MFNSNDCIYCGDCFAHIAFTLDIMEEEMKDLTFDEFVSQLGDHINGVAIGGDMIRVDCGNAGVFVILDEAEYNIMREALKMMLGASDGPPKTSR